MSDSVASTADEATPREQVAVLLAAIAVGVFGLIAGVGLTLGALVVLSLLGIGLGLTTLVVISLVLTQGIAFGGTALGYLRFRNLGLDFVHARVPTGRHLLWIVGGYLLALVAAYAGGMLATLAGLEPASNQIGEVGLENPEILLWLVPLSILLIGPGEELLFRGVVQGTIRQRFGPVSGVVLASAVFAAIHFPALAGGTGSRLVTIGILFFPSLVFGAAYERTRNLVVPSLIHGIYNATLFGIVYLATQLDEMPQALVWLL